MKADIQNVKDETKQISEMKTDIQKERDKFRPIGGEQAINTHSNYQTVNSQFHRVSIYYLRL